MGWLWVLLLLQDPVPGTASYGAEDAMEVTGALGESVTFQLKTSPPFELISWLKSERNKDPSNIAILMPKERCTPNILLRDFQGRLNASEDCRKLQVRDLRRGDSGRYTAFIQQEVAGNPLRETFDLRMYKRLSEADLTVRCHTTGNGTRQLNCSAGPWEDDVVVSWDDASKAELWGKSAIMELSGNDLNITCRARNPVGEASRTVSVQEICAGLNGVQVSSPLLGVTAAVLIAIKMVVSACVFAKWLSRCPGRKREPPVHIRLRKRVAAGEPSLSPP
uniref:SLAM family member 9-like n=1 Tax=Pogona vitticeps TaxID=103695 RepID=A0ABM5F4H7_9SAUR